MHMLSRREFLRNLTLFSALGVAPHFLTRTVEGAALSIEGFNDDRVLVVVQLGGGNDGLNTVIPHGDDAYYRARPTIGLKKDRILRINDDIALNDRLTGLRALYDDGQLGIVQGVGYPNPDRSHFRSMEIWQTASDSGEFMSTGWIGRYFDRHCSGAARPQVGVAVGLDRPQAFESEAGYGVSFDDPRTYGWRDLPGENRSAEFASLNAPAPGEGDTIDFLRHVTSNAILSSHEVQEAAKKAGVRNGAKNFALSLDLVAGMIRGDLSTRVYFVSATGFDTHAGQLGRQDNLLKAVGDGMKGFQDRLKADGTADRVTTMVFSEFGRRVTENASAGTDHGTAAPMFLIGNHIKPGVHGLHPSLTDLDNGDLKFTTDFRGVYAAVLKDWLRVQPKSVLGGEFGGVSVIA